MKKNIHFLLRAILPAILLGTALCARGEVRLANETLTYNVLYKWGLIHKQAGTATIRVHRNGNHYDAIATARSAKWADKFYPLRDTLRSTMSAVDLAPSRYERLAHEDGKFSHDLLIIKRSGNTFSTTAQRWRRKKGKTTTDYATTSLTAQGMTVDLLSSFFYLRSLPFSTMNPGTSVKLNIFSGRRKELLSITYKGISSLKIKGTNYQAFKVVFTFTSDGKKQTSDPIEAWISMDGRNIPLKLIGKLKIGQVQCIYSGKL